jgi:hypothetical protein
MLQVRTAFTATLVILAFAVTPLFAQYVEMYRLDNRVKDLPEQEVLSALASHLGVSVDVLKQQKAEYKSSVGELYIANQFAKLTRSDVKNIMTEKSSKSWGSLAKDRGIDMDQVARDARQLEDALKKAHR